MVMKPKDLKIVHKSLADKKARIKLFRFRVVCTDLNKLNSFTVF